MTCSRPLSLTLLLICLLSICHLLSVDAIFNKKAPNFSRILCRQKFESEQPSNRRTLTRTLFCTIRGGASYDSNDDNQNSTEISPDPQNVTFENSIGANTQLPFSQSDKKKYILSLQETTLRARQLFLDKISLVSTALLKSERDAIVDNVTEHCNPLLDDVEEGDENDNVITLQSDLLRPGRKMAIVTTASIPWFTGTSVNPLLRAAYLSRLTKSINSGHANATEQMVTLVIPWLEMEEDRLELYGDKHNFTSSEEQEVYIRKWLREEANMPEEADPEHGIKIVFYPARYHSGLKSIFAMGDIMSVIPDSDSDVCILEEPEHLNWYRAPGNGWTKKFKFVVGIIHTNYVEYASSHYSGLWTAPAIKAMSSAMVRAYCHVVIKLSDTLQTFAEEKERTSNVHGVRLDFLTEGDRRAAEFNDTYTDSMENEEKYIPSMRKAEICNEIAVSLSTVNPADTTQVYFVGKLLWAKGLDKMLELESYYKTCTRKFFAIDIYGNGPEEKEIKRAFHGRSGNSSIKRNIKQAEVYLEKDEVLDEEEEVAMSKVDNSSVVSKRVAKISKHIKATTQTFKMTTESMELDLPKSFHELRREPIPSTFPGRVDHATLSQYKIFVNPSLSEVLCTTTAEVSPKSNYFVSFFECSKHYLT